MFGSIRRHSKWLWFPIIILVILSFVWYMGPSSSSSGGISMGGRGSYGTINGRPLSREEVNEAHQEARLQFFLYTQSWPEESPAARQMFDAERQVAERLVLIDKLRQFKVQVDDRAVAAWIAQQFRDPQRGVVNLDYYRQFIERGLRRGGLSEDTFRRFARHEVGIRHLISMGGMAGSLLPPREAERAFRRENEQLTVQLAVFSSSNYLAEVIVTPEAITNFFTLESARYRAPDRVRVSYVRFASTNHLGDADRQLDAIPDLSVQLEAEYRQRGTNTFLDAAGEVLSQEAAVARLREEFRDRIALMRARQVALDFGEELLALYEEHPEQHDHLEKVAEAKGLPSAVTEPFARFERPVGLAVPMNFSQAAFELSPASPLSLDPVSGEDGVYLLGYKERISGQIPDLEEVRLAVTADYRRREARNLAREAAQRFQAALTNGIAQGRSFDAISEELGVVPVRPAPFARSTQTLPALPAGVDLPQLKGIALDLKPNEVSAVEDTRDGGAVVVHLITREPVDESRVAAELAGFTDELRSERRQAAIGEWFRRELELARVSGLPEELRGSRRSEEP
jgi:hypothetical protein